MYAGFLQHIAVAPNFAAWINAATVEASKFQVYGIPLSDIDGDLLPLSASDAIPLSILCSMSISRWVDMQYLFVCLHIVHIMGSQFNEDESDCFCRYLSQVATSLHPATYASLITDPKRFLNIGYHVQLHGV